jgi:hypothetical protein
MPILYDLSKLPSETRELIENSAKYTALFSKFPDKILGIDSNAKTVKGQKQMVLTGIFYGTPYNGSGVNMCSMAVIAQCHMACLFTAGRGAMLNVFLSRLRKTLCLQQFPDVFKEILIKDIKKLERKAQRLGMVPMVRLNGTTDIRWEIFFPELFTMFPNVQFYDYTKIANRKTPSNYHLTVSYFGNDIEYKKAIKNGSNVAMVFDTQNNPKLPLPSEYNGMKVIDGDLTDLRTKENDGTNVIVGLRAKMSKANIEKELQKETSFVVRA